MMERYTEASNRFWKVLCHQEVDSTNLEAARLVEAEKARSGYVIKARHQTDGRGRRGRRWFDVPGKSLLASLLLGGMDGAHASRLVSVSAVNAIKAAGGEGPKIKWPNDLVYGWRKAGGVLAETAGDLVAVGLGINVSQHPDELGFPSSLEPTSLLIEEGLEFNMDDLLAVVLEQAHARIGNAPESIMREYRRLMAHVGCVVSFEYPAGHARGAEHFQGLVEGVDDDGNLILENPQGTVRLSTGDLATAGIVPIRHPDHHSETAS